MILSYLFTYVGMLSLHYYIAHTLHYLKHFHNCDQIRKQTTNNSGVSNLLFLLGPVINS